MQHVYRYVRTVVLSACFLCCIQTGYAQGPRRARFDCQVVMVPSSAWKSGAERATILLAAQGERPRILLKEGAADATDLMAAVHTLLLARQLGRGRPTRAASIRVPAAAQTVAPTLGSSELQRANAFLLRLSSASVANVPGVGSARAASLFLPRTIGVANVK